MVRPLETANTTDPRQERQFDGKVIVAFIGGAILLILIYFFVHNIVGSYSETRGGDPATQQRTQEKDRRAEP